MKYRWLNIILSLSVLSYLFFLLKEMPDNTPKMYKLDSSTNDYQVDNVYRLQNTSVVPESTQKVLKNESIQECKMYNKDNQVIWILTDELKYEYKVDCSDFTTVIKSFNLSHEEKIDFHEIIQRFDIEIIQSINGYYSFSKWTEIDI